MTTGDSSRIFLVPLVPSRWIFIAKPQRQSDQLDVLVWLHAGGWIWATHKLTACFSSRILVVYIGICRDKNSSQAVQHPSELQDSDYLYSILTSQMINTTHTLTAIPVYVFLCVYHPHFTSFMILVILLTEASFTVQLKILMKYLHVCVATALWLIGRLTHLDMVVGKRKAPYEGCISALDKMESKRTYYN